MTDAEVICTWMEPRPTVTLRQWRAEHPENSDGDRYYPKWWIHQGNYESAEWVPYELRLRSLDALWEVEERLTDEQWFRYEALLACAGMKGGDVRPTIEIVKRHIHATPEQKIKALAAVLRPLVTEAPRTDGRGASNNEGAEDALEGHAWKEQAAPHEQERECPHRKALASTMAPLLHASQASIEGLSKLGGIGKLNSAARRAYDEAQSALQSPCVPLGEIEEALRPVGELAAKFVKTEQRFSNLPNIVQDEDRISVEYPWLEFRAILRVRDLRRLAALHSRLQVPR